MPANRDKTSSEWSIDTRLSVEMYNAWFLSFAPTTFRRQRLITTEQVEEALIITDNLTRLKSDELMQAPQLLFILRMMTSPPLARDRLMGLASLPNNLVAAMEDMRRFPPKMDADRIKNSLEQIIRVITQLIDYDLFPWLNLERLVAQEERQLNILQNWLAVRGYHEFSPSKGLTYLHMAPGTFAKRMNMPGQLPNGSTINIPIDVVIKTKASSPSDMPVLIEAKSAGDSTNTNKRRKEEENKLSNLRRQYSAPIQFVLFLCGYFDSAYLSFEAASGIDWVWEHRVDDFLLLGV